MVRIKDFKTVQNDQGEDFNMLILEGDLEMVKSASTGKYYATAKTCSIACTFDAEGCKKLIGTSMAGRITKVTTEPYEYLIPNSDEVITLEHTYQYDPNGSMEESVLDEALIQ